MDTLEKSATVDVLFDFCSFSRSISRYHLKHALQWLARCPLYLDIDSFQSL